MHEPDLYNNTPFKAEMVPFIARDGADARLVVVKASYKLLPHGGCELLKEQRPVRLGSETWGPPEIADDRFPSDLHVGKPGTDFVIAGHAVAAQQKPVPFIDVRIAFADRTRALRAYGPRAWLLLHLRQMELSQPKPVEKIPLCWALAYGGRDESEASKVLECKENPVGRGVARDIRTLHGQPGPQIEDPRHPVREPNQGLSPVGVSALAPLFEPRRSLAGTYDKRWLEDVHPAKPADYQPRFEHVAPREFIFDKPLRGGESGRIEGMTPEGRLTFQVPVERPFVEWTIDGKDERHEPHLDTVLVDTDGQVMELVWHTAIRTPVKLRKRFTRAEVFRKKVLR